MDKINSFQDFLATQSVQVPVMGFIINFMLAAFLAYLMGLLYIRYGTSLSNRKLFSKNFILLTLITMLVISIVKSSLALSLGLVGALSIVRFRAAIKEPEELMYLFFAISVGLGLGANQTTITITAFTITSIIIIALKHNDNSRIVENLFLTVSSDSPQDNTLNNISNVLKENCASVQIKRLNESRNSFEATFTVEINELETLDKIKKQFLKIDENINITFLDNRNLV